MRRFVRSACVGHLIIVLSIGRTAPAAAQAGDENVATRTIMTEIDTALSGRYRAGGVHRFLFGTRYRSLWTTPVRVPVLDLGTFSGGLQAVERGSGVQAGSLRLLDAEGREYVLRAADADAASSLPPELQGTLVSRLFQDQISAVHPFGALVADRLGGAVGLPRLLPRLVVVADDPALGEFREDFAGLVGYLLEHPTAGFREVISTETLLRRRREQPDEWVDACRYLTARLLDILLGDWDRRRSQWRWGRNDRGSAWQPIPRDRDYVFSQYDGLVPALVRAGPAPHFVRFGEGRLPVAGLVWSSRDLDREILPRLGWPAWDSVATAVQARLTDAAIDSAVAEMPPGVPEPSRSWLAATLRARRARLPDAARRFYLSLAAEADLHATDAAERITTAGEPNGAVQVHIAGPGAGSRVARHFEPSETREVRIYAHGGADTVITRGGAGRVRVRVIGGEGADVVRRAGGPNIHLEQDGADWRPLPREEDLPPPRDWGGRTTFLPFVATHADAGLVVGGHMTHMDYGFRKLPFASRTTVKTAFGTTSGRPGLAVGTIIQTASPWLRFAIAAKVSGIEVLRFYAPGNESIEAEDRDFHTVRNWQVELAPTLEVTAGPGLTFGLGPRMRYLDSELSADRLIGSARPYGGGEFGELGARAYARWDLMGVPANPRRGLLLEVGGDLVPAVWDAEESFSSAYAAAATFISLRPGWSPTLHLRVGGRQVWGRYPYFEAARLGGGGSIRGYSTGRFLGDASVFGQAEIRVPLGPVKLIVPGRIGVLGLADAGRVFLEGETSDVWHGAVGGGVWFEWLGGAKVFSLAVAQGSERTTLTFRTGLGF
jgi:hypothetical protein